MSGIFMRTIVMTCCVILFLGNYKMALAEVSLPEGTVEGLPQKLTIVDDEGNSVNSDTGEFFFYVEDMVPHETYSKDVQIMNLLEDEVYHIYFYAEPVSKSGKIDLEDECTAVITLDGDRIYEGSVTGQGNVDMTEEPIDLGLYEPGEQRSLRCSITWNGTDAGGYVDLGERVVDSSGTTIVDEGSGDRSIRGEVTFKWIFYAVSDDDYVPPKTGLISNVWVEVCVLATLGLALIIMLLLVRRRKKEATGAGLDEMH